MAVTSKQTGIVKNPEKILWRFRDKFVTEPNSGCWLWTDATFPNGYGRFKVDGKSLKAHRVSYELHNGLIPEGLHVCHTCDVRVCVNPDHLWLGTNQDNVNDRDAKGRQSKGSANGQAKLTEEQVWELYHSEDTQREIAAQYGVSPAQVSRIKRKKGWRHLHEERT